VWHGAFHCLIFYEQDGLPTALFQKRSARKKIAPGRLDVSVGGHYVSGEDAKIAGPREISEELGIEVRFEELVPVGRRVFVYESTPGVRDYEFQDVFLLHHPVKTNALVLQREELDGVFELGVDSGIIFFLVKRRASRVCFVQSMVLLPGLFRYQKLILFPFSIIITSNFFC